MSYAKYYGQLVRNSGYSLAKGVALPFVRNEAVRSGAHAMAYPISTYAPWEADQEFRRTFQAVRKNTLVDVWRCHELWGLVQGVQHIPGAILEVGVWRGGSGALLAARAASLGITDPVYLCDTWTGVVKTTAVDVYYEDGKHDDTSIEIVRALLRRLQLSDVVLLQGIFPDETAHEIASEQVLRLCHVDVDVYESARDVFAWAWPRLSPGGVVVFDDYGFAACPGVTSFVEELRGHDDRLVLHNLNGHAIVVKRY